MTPPLSRRSIAVRMVLPAVVFLTEGRRQAVQPVLDEHVDRAGGEPVADLLQRGRVGAGGEPVGQFGEAEPDLGGLAFGPLVTVDPDLSRAGEVCDPGTRCPSSPARREHSFTVTTHAKPITCRNRFYGRDDELTDA